MLSNVEGEDQGKDKTKIVNDSLAFCVLDGRARITVSRGLGPLRAARIHGCNSINQSSDLQFTVFRAQLLKRVSSGRVVRPERDTK